MTRASPAASSSVYSNRADSPPADSKPSPRVVITGSSGRVGSRLADRLCAEGFSVVGYDRVPSRSSAGRFETVIGKLDDQRLLHRTLEGADAVVHLAAAMSWVPESRGGLFEVNVHGTFNVLEAARAGRVAQCVFASSGEVYPELNPQYCPLDESHPLRPQSDYGVTKLLGERMVVSLADTSDTGCCILRFAHTQDATELLDPSSKFSGPRFFVGPKIAQLSRLPSTPAIDEAIKRLRSVCGADRSPHARLGDQLYVGCDSAGVPYRMGICDSRDAVSAILLTLRRRPGPCEVFNIGPSKSFDFAEAVGRMARLTGRTAIEVPLPTTPYRYETSIEKARTQLGYEPRYSIEDMIDEAAEHWTASISDDSVA